MAGQAVDDGRRELADRLLGERPQRAEADGRPGHQLRPLTREAARTLAALVVEGLPDPKSP